MGCTGLNYHITMIVVYVAVTVNVLLVLTKGPKYFFKQIQKIKKTPNVALPESAIFYMADHLIL